MCSRRVRSKGVRERVSWHDGTLSYASTTIIDSCALLIHSVEMKRCGLVAQIVL
jgi:hypothetical protein